MSGKIDALIRDVEDTTRPLHRGVIADALRDMQAEVVRQSELAAAAVDEAQSARVERDEAIAEIEGMAALLDAATAVDDTPGFEWDGRQIVPVAACGWIRTGVDRDDEEAAYGRLTLAPDETVLVGEPAETLYVLRPPKPAPES